MTEDGSDKHRRRSSKEVGDGAGSPPETARPDNTARELLWTACHDLANPLSAIRLIAQKVLGRQRSEVLLSNEELQELVTRIDRVAGNAIALIDDVLAVERGEQRPEAEPHEDGVDVEDTLGEAVSLHAEALARAGCSVYVTRADGLDRVRGSWNRRALERLFSNLLQNVARHAPGAPVNVHLSSRQRWLLVRFADRGPGLSASFGDLGARSFLDSRTPGSRHGLGLWIIHRTVAELGGEIAMQTAPGAGVAFEIKLPL